MGFTRDLKNYFKRIKRIKSFEKAYFSKLEMPVFDSNFKFKSAENPKVSIVIFGNGNLENTFASLQKNLSDAISIELFVIGNSQNTASIPFINDPASSLTANFNAVIKKAKGEYVYLLPAGNMVSNGFLGELLSVFGNFENVGAVGSQSIDGKRNLLQSGGFVLENGKIQTLRENTKAFYPEVNFISKTDFCANDLLFKRQSDSGELQLFDEQFSASDCWEADFCWNFKYKKGKDSYYTPFSELVSNENPIAKNPETFIQKWSAQIAQIKANSIAERIGEMHENRAVVLFCDMIPEHDKDSGSNRFKEIINAFLELKFQVVLVSKYTYIDNKYIAFYEHMGVNVFYEHKKYSGFENFLERQKTNASLAWFYGPRVFMKYYKAAKRELPNAKLVYDMVDIHHLRYERAMALEPKRISNHKRFRVYKKMEFEASKIADFVITISDFEENYMKSVCDANKIVTISNIHYPKINKNDTLSFEKRSGIVFIGSKHTPNIDALYYLYNDIMPIVWAQLPGVKVDIIGTIDKIVTDISHPDFVFHGYVPTVDELFASSRLMVAPLRYGAGVKGKIGQAFEYYLPVVTTSIGAEGMKLTNGENALIEDDTQRFAEAIIRLYNDAALWHHLQGNSEKSLEPFSTKTLKTTLKTIIK